VEAGTRKTASIQNAVTASSSSTVNCEPLNGALLRPATQAPMRAAAIWLTAVSVSFPINRIIERPPPTLFRATIHKSVCLSTPQPVRQWRRRSVQHLAWSRDRWEPPLSSLGKLEAHLSCAPQLISTPRDHKMRPLRDHLPKALDCPNPSASTKAAVLATMPATISS
jgi:hypothetical protein